MQFNAKTQLSNKINSKSWEYIFWPIFKPNGFLPGWKGMPQVFWKLVLFGQNMSTCESVCNKIWKGIIKFVQL